MLHLSTVKDHHRLSTQDLLLAIEAAVAKGETDFFVEASGQHDIGGPLWNSDGKKLSFRVTNPGQRVGCMCMPNTEIVVDGPAPADVGWLNAGGRITVRGDAGDTAGHCAAAGTIYVGGRAGTRTGSLMKHDPMYEAPQLWVLRSVGSFSFEFMGGGTAVVCGHESQTLPSVLGERPCVGMVGGVVYVRGPVGALPADVELVDIDSADIDFLASGMKDFLASIEQPRLLRELTVWKHWKKIVPLAFGQHKQQPLPDMRQFRTGEWINGGIFSDVCPDDFGVNGLVARDEGRLRVPHWNNALFAAPCEFNCPASIPSQQRFNLLRQGKVDEAYRLVLDYTPFPGSVCGSVCPNPCMQGCSRSQWDSAVQIGQLGRCSADLEIAKPAQRTGKHVGIIGGGVAGLTAAWQLARKGHEVTVYEADKVMGGKLEQVIPRERLNHDLLVRELGRIEALGVHLVTSHPVDAKEFARLRKKHHALIVASGGHRSRTLPCPGKERIVAGIDFLKAINRGEKPKVPHDVVVIGCGNAGMDAAVGAYRMGAGKVTCIDVQKPAAFEHEIAHVQGLGGELLWPVQTQKITDKGLVTSEGRTIPAEMVIITIGETPDLSYLPDGIEKFRDWLVPGRDRSIMEGVFAAGDVIRPALLATAIGSGNEAALACDAWLGGKQAELGQKQLVPASRLNLAYFARCHHNDLPEAQNDFERCVSCGTCRDCRMCLESCPEKAIERREGPNGFEYVSNPARCIGCGICAGVCPCGIWTMQANG